MKGNVEYWLCWIIMILFWIFLWTKPTFPMTFKEYINMPIQTVESKDELRIKWKDFLGIDLFQPYFVIRDVEASFREFTAIDFGRLKGRLRFGNRYKEVEYKFKYEF